MEVYGLVEKFGLVVKEHEFLLQVHEAVVTRVVSMEVGF